MEMSYMKRIICFVLALVCILSLTCTAFAADAGSPGNQPCDHTYENGKCTKCGDTCDHNSVKDGVCTICGLKVDGISPKTGDVIMMWVTVLVVAVAALAAAVVIFRKKFVR